MEENNRPIIHHALSSMKRVKDELQGIYLGSSSGPELCVSNDLAQYLAEKILEELNAIRIHDLWIADCIIHAGVCDLPFISPRDDV